MSGTRGDRSPPVLSLILVTNRDLAQLRPALAALAEQPNASQMEVLVVAARGRVPEGALDEFSDFHSARLVEVEEVSSRGRAAAAAVWYTHAPFIGFRENHYFDMQGGIEILLRRFPNGAGAIAPAIVPANPDDRWGLALSVMTHGQCALPLPPAILSLPYQTAIYRRDALRAFERELGDLLHDERKLHRALLRSGWELAVCGDAVAFHLNDGRRRQCIRSAFACGRRFAAAETADATLAHRAMRLAAGPLSLARRMSHLWRTARRLEATRAWFPALLPRLTAIAASHFAGEMVAYAAGQGVTEADFDKPEFMVRSRLHTGKVCDDRIARFLKLLPAGEP